MKVSEIYKMASTHNRAMLMSNNLRTYPTIEGNTTNFVDDYMTNHKHIDLLFAQRYGDREVILIDLHEDPGTAVNDWIEMCDGIVSYYMQSWARLYYALLSDFNPLYNVDGTEIETMEGFTNKESGTEKRTVKNGKTKTTSTDSAVPYDITTEKEIGKNIIESDAVTDNDDTVFGKNNEVDTTRTLTRFGNIGVTKSTDLVGSAYDLYKSHEFFDLLTESIAKDLTYYKAGE